MSEQCRTETEQFRIGRNVAEVRRCKRRTNHPSGKCFQHRSDEGSWAEAPNMPSGCGAFWNSPCLRPADHDGPHRYAWQDDATTSPPPETPVTDERNEAE